MADRDQWSKVDTRDAKFLALTTKINALEHQQVAVALVIAEDKSRGSNGGHSRGGAKP